MTKKRQSTDVKPLTDYEIRLVNNALRRKNLFFTLSLVSVVIALSLAAFYSWQAYTQEGFDGGIHFIVVILILLNARQNLRQYHYAKVLEKQNADVAKIRSDF